MPRDIRPPDVPPKGTISDPPPLFPPNFERLNFHTDWRRPWTHIVAGKFSQSPYDGLLCYEQSTGYAEFYETDGLGRLTLLQGHTGWRSTWTHILSGAFYGTERTALLFYDQGAGQAEVYDTDGQGNLVFPGRQYSDWLQSTHITTLRMPLSKHSTHSDFSAVLLYDQRTGIGQIHECTGGGSLHLVIQESGWRTSWTHVVGDAFCGNGVLFYEQPTRHAEVYAVTDSDAGLGFEQWSDAENLPAATDVIPGNFGWADSSFLFYDRPNGRATFVFHNPGDTKSGTLGSILFDPNDGVTRWETYDGWRTTWDTVVPGNFWEPDPEYVKFQNGFTDLLFFDQAARYSEFFLHEPFDAIPVVDLEGFVTPGSVIPGETINFYVNSRAGPYTISVYMQGKDLDPILMATVADIDQYPQPFPIRRLDYRDGPAWPVIASLTIPITWRSGLYLARVEATSGQAAPLVIPFVVRAQNPGRDARVLLCVPDATYTAYNFWGGRSLYGFSTRGAQFWSYGPSLDPYANYQIPRAFRVAHARPYSQPFGGPLPKWQQWEIPLIRWLACQGIAVDLCTGTDLHKDQANHTGLLNAYRLLVSVGHDEYWSKEMRDNVEGFASSGGNVLFLSGNVSWFQIRFDLNVQRQICYKDRRFDPYNPTASNPGSRELVTVRWFEDPVCRAETAMTGVSYLGSSDSFPQYRIPDRSSWAFKDVAYSRFGIYSVSGDPIPKTIVGYETDRFQRSDDPCQPNSPGGFTTLAEVPALLKDNHPVDFNDPSAEIAATMGIFTTQGQGQVLTVGTINWSLGLTHGDRSQWNEIDQITWNIFDRLTN